MTFEDPGEGVNYVWDEASTQGNMNLTGIHVEVEVLQLNARYEPLFNSGCGKGY